jgi:hypothetical protein
MRANIMARTKELAASLRLDINTERHWNSIHPDEEPSRAFDGLDPDLGDVELLRQFMAQEASRRGDKP